MRFNMWTFYEYLNKNGLRATADISSGAGSILHLRMSSDPASMTRDPDTAYIFEDLAHRKRSAMSTVVSCGADRIIVHGAGVTETFNCLASCCDFYNGWEKTLLKKLIANSPIGEILNTAHEAFHRPMFIKSAGSMIYAITEGYGNDVHINWSRFLDIASSRTPDIDSVMDVSSHSAFQTAFMKTYPSLMTSPVYNGIVLHTNIWIDRARVAEIVVLENGAPFNNGDPHVMHVFQKIVAKYMMQNSEVYLSSTDERSYFIGMLDGQPYHSGNTEHVRHALRWEESDEIAVACIADSTKCVTPMLNDLNEQLVSEMKNSCIFIYKDMIFGAVNVTRNGGYRNVSAKIRRLIGRKPVVCALSYEFRDIAEIPSFFRQCCGMLETYAEKREENLLTAYDTAAPFIKNSLRAMPDAATYVHPDLRRLQAFDAAHNTDYLHTLFNFINLGCNYTDTANRMNLHRNTLIYRISRIKEIIESDIDDFEAREKLLFSFILIDTQSE